MLLPCHLVLHCESSRYGQRIETNKNALATFSSGARRIHPLLVQPYEARRRSFDDPWLRVGFWGPTKNFGVQYLIPLYLTFNVSNGESIGSKVLVNQVRYNSIRKS